MPHLFDFLCKLFCWVDNHIGDEEALVWNGPTHLKWAPFRFQQNGDLDWRCVINPTIMRSFLPNSRWFFLESWAAEALKWTNGRSMDDYSTQSDTGSILHLKWLPSSFGEHNIHTRQRQTKMSTKHIPTHDVLNLEKDACSWRQMSWVSGEKWNVEHVSSLMWWYIIQQYLVMACIHSVNGSVKVTGVIQLNYDCNHDPCHQ